LSVIFDTNVNVARARARGICAGVRNGKNTDGFSEVVYKDALEGVVGVINFARTITLLKVDANALSEQISYNTEINFRYVIHSD
jgi:hypothetical protein